jgi:acetate---CoA ligase (ADP-forming)
VQIGEDILVTTSVAGSSQITSTRRRQDIHDFLNPRGVAIVGGLNRALPGDATRSRYDSLFGPDNWYLVSQKGGTIGEIPVYRSIGEIPGHVDLAVLSTPAASMGAMIDTCAASGVRFAVVFTSGFAEVGGDGIAYERNLAEAARRTGIRVLGPNTNVNAFERFSEPAHASGSGIVMVAQSGHTPRPVVQGRVRGMRFLRMVPCGNEVDLDVCDFIEYFADDPETGVITGYIEGFRDVRKLRRALAAAQQAAKPIILIKVGSTAAGREMAGSHTGHMAGSDDVLNGLFHQYGVIRVKDIDELIETASLFSRMPESTGSGLGLYSISGGSIALMAEHAAANGLPIPVMDESAQHQLRQFLPEYLRVSNPVDNGANFINAATPGERRRVLDIIASDPAIDVVVIGLTGQVSPMTDLMTDDLVAMASTGYATPVVVTWNSPLIDDDGYRKVIASGYPVFGSFRNCFKALADFQGWRASRERVRGSADSVELTQRQYAIVQQTAGGVVPERAAADLLTSIGLPVVRQYFVSDAEEARSAAEDLGFPVVMKIVSPDIAHKSDGGFVRIGVLSAEEAGREFSYLVERAAATVPEAHVDGVVVQATIRDAVEVIVGIADDPVVGLALLVGMGGIFTELYADVSVRPLPIDEQDAREMIESLRGYPLLTGLRGRPRADVESLVQLVRRVAALAVAAQGRITEIDLNPVMVRADGCVIVDALLITTPTRRPD